MDGCDPRTDDRAPPKWLDLDGKHGVRERMRGAASEAAAAPAQVHSPLAESSHVLASSRAMGRTVAPRCLSHGAAGAGHADKGGPNLGPTTAAGRVQARVYISQCRSNEVRRHVPPDISHVGR